MVMPDRYTTHLVGKWHAGMSHPSLVPGARGFDESLGYRTLPSPFANSGLSSFLSGYFLFETDPNRLLTRLTFTVAGSEDHWLHTNGGPTCGSKNKTAACCVDMFNTTQPVLDAKARYTGVRKNLLPFPFVGASCICLWLCRWVTHPRYPTGLQRVYLHRAGGRNYPTATDGTNVSVPGVAQLPPPDAGSRRMGGALSCCNVPDSEDLSGNGVFC